MSQNILIIKYVTHILAFSLLNNLNTKKFIISLEENLTLIRHLNYSLKHACKTFVRMSNVKVYIILKKEKCKLLTKKYSIK